jgi:integrase/recombinase XerD
MNDVSALHPYIVRYIAMKQALGRGFLREQGILMSLDQFLVCQNEHDLDANNFARWCHSKQHLASGVLRNHMRIVRNLCQYRQRTVPSCFVPDKRLFPSNHQPIQPHIFTDNQISCLLKTVNALPPSPVSPLRAAVFRLAIILLYTAGLRRGELLRLTVGDYNPRNQVVTILESKFHSTRYLPLSSDATREIDHYLSLRRQHHLPTDADTSLICNAQRGGRAYTGTCLLKVIQDLMRTCDIHTADGRPPRLHDFRHSFAVNALLRWYREGADVQAKLPLLATYMGHVSIVSTEYYLHFIAELAAVSSARFATHYAALVHPLTKQGDGQ